MTPCAPWVDWTDRASWRAPQAPHELERQHWRTYRHHWHPCTKLWIGGCRGHVSLRTKLWNKTDFLQWVPGASRNWGANQLWMLERLKKYGTPCERRNR